MNSKLHTTWRFEPGRATNIPFTLYTLTGNTLTEPGKLIIR
jgi:hypothetical protein